MKKKDMPKSFSEIVHFKRSLANRWGINIIRKEYDRYCTQAKKAEVVIKQSMRVSIRRIMIRDIPMFCVYDCFRERLVTVLPKEVDSPEKINGYEDATRREFLRNHSDFNTVLKGRGE
jgi:hypothetical protein